MPIKRYKPEQIVTMLRQIEVGIANGKTTPQACKEAENHYPDVLPLAVGIRGVEDGPSQAAERTGTIGKTRICFGRDERQEF
jgi:hypothetical protein